MPLTPDQYKAIDALKEKHAYTMDMTLDDAVYKEASAAFNAICAVLTIIGE